MGDECGSSTPSSLDNYVRFCCEDVGDTISIIVQVTDMHGNHNTCMTTVVVEDKVPPMITHPLPDISISCDYPLDLNDMNAFGTFIATGSSRNNIFINDLGNPYYSNGIAGQDGVYSDNCPNVQVRYTVRSNLNMCNLGDVFRDFTLIDIAGNTTTFTQKVTVFNKNPFVEDNFTWPPQDVFFAQCNVSVPPISITGEPIITNNRCSQAAASYTDQSFAHPVHCRYIRRTWTVLDWCQYQRNTPGSPGRWTYVQNIYITNDVAPTISAVTCENRTICTPDNACEATHTFTAAGTDDCMPTNITWTYKLDLNNNGTIDVTGAGASSTRTYPLGTHRLTWEAKDGCSNISTCSFEFIVRDCKKPTAIAMQGLAINLQAGMAMAQINARSFDNFSSDNCTPRPQLKFSFSPNVNDTIRFFNCDSLGIRRIEFWVTDLAGNQSRTITHIDVQDNHSQCGNLPSFTIAGAVYTEENVHVPNVKILLDGAEIAKDAMTDDKGKYCFENLEMFNDYLISSNKTDNPSEGISTLDLVMIQRHILGIQEMNSPYKLIAADINNSQSLTAADLTELRKIILGLQDNFSNNTSWRFVNAGYQFSDKTRPWNFEEAMMYEGLDAHMTSSDFIAIKVGDVNGTISQNLQGKDISSRTSPLVLNIENKNIQSNQWETLPVSITSNENILGMQWTLELSREVEELAIEPERLNISESNFAYITKGNKKYLTFSYNESESIDLREGEVLFNLNILTSSPGSIDKFVSFSNDITPSESYDDQLNPSKIRLTYHSKQKGISIDATVSQNYPNPFKDNTQITVSCPKDETVTISIFDNTGSRVYNTQQHFVKGENIINITDKMLKNGSGKFICKITSSQLNEIVRMIRID